MTVLTPQLPASGASTPEVQRQVLGGAARKLAAALDFRDSLRQTLDACLPALGDFGFFDVLHEGQVLRTVAAHDAPDIEAILAPTRQGRQDCNESSLHADTDDDWSEWMAAGEGRMALLRQLAFTSMVTVPMRYRGEVVGALNLFMGRSGRADPRGRAMRLVALTGYGRDNDRAKALAASFDEHLVKPVAIERLLQVVGELLHPSLAKPTGTA